MYVQVLRVVDRERRQVQAELAGQTVRLVWQGPGDVPATGGFDIELDVEGSLEWGRDIWPAASDEPHAQIPGQLRLRGRLLELDPLDVASVDTGHGIVLLDTYGDPPLGTVGEDIVFEAPYDVHAFPFTP